MATAEKSERAAWAERMERLARLVPGVGAYQDREGLRDTDKRGRTYLAELLGNVGKDLEPAQQRLVRGTGSVRISFYQGLWPHPFASLVKRKKAAVSSA